VVRKLVVGAVVAGAVSFGAALPSFAGAPTCYTGCTPGPMGSGPGPYLTPGTPVINASGSPGPGSGVTPREAAPPSGGLPFTGADVAGSVGIASVLLVAGGAMVRVSRRRAHRAL